MRFIKIPSIFILLLAMSLASYAQDSVSNNKTITNKKLLISMYHYFESLKSKPLIKKDLIAFFTPNVQMIVNDHLVSKGIDAFYEHFQLMLSQSRDNSFILPNDSMITEGNRVAIKYKIERKGKHSDTIYVLSYFTFVNNKISLWDEVVAKETPKEMGIDK